MLRPPGAMVAVVTVTLTVAADALAADQTIAARTSPDRWDTPNVTIDVGDTVTFTNAAGTHNVKFADGLFEMPLTAVDQRWTYARTSPVADEYGYLCEEHSSMTGAVTVRPAPGPGPGDPPPGGPGPGDPPPGGPGPGPGSDPAPGLTPLRVAFKLERRDSPCRDARQAVRRRAPRTGRAQGADPEAPARRQVRDGRRHAAA